MRLRRGFTLIELMIVVAIIGILAAIAIPKFAELIRKSKEGKTKGNLGALRSAISIYYGDMEGLFPNELRSLTVSGKYLSPMPAVTAAKKKERLGQIGQIIEGRGVQCLVVGYPYNMDGTVGFKAREVDLFIATLERTFGLPVFRADERLTTDEALRRTDRRRRRSRRERNRERASGALDSHAATIILQEFLDSPEDTRGEHPPLDP